MKMFKIINKIIMIIKKQKLFNNRVMNKYNNNKNKKNKMLKK